MRLTNAMSRPWIVGFDGVLDPSCPFECQTRGIAARGVHSTLRITKLGTGSPGGHAPLDNWSMSMDAITERRGITGMPFGEIVTVHLIPWGNGEQGVLCRLNGRRARRTGAGQRRPAA